MSPKWYKTGVELSFQYQPGLCHSFFNKKVTSSVQNSSHQVSGPCSCYFFICMDISVMDMWMYLNWIHPVFDVPLSGQWPISHNSCIGSGSSFLQLTTNWETFPWSDNFSSYSMILRIPAENRAAGAGRTTKRQAPLIWIRIKSMLFYFSASF